MKATAQRTVSPSPIATAARGHTGWPVAAARVPDTFWRSAAREAAPSQRGFRQRALLRAHSYMEDHIGENVSLGDLAQAACVSRFHFARMFRVSTGKSPMAFLLRLRIERAKEMLRGGNAKIAEVAAALGFFDQSHFARSFRRVTGLSPREFMHEGADACGHAAGEAPLRMAADRISANAEIRF